MDGRATRLKAEKSTVVAALERQRMLLQEFDKQRLSGVAGGAEPTSWEAEQEAQLDTLRQKLERLRLEGDEFQVLKEGGAEALVAVSARGLVIFFEFKRSPVAVPPPTGVQFYALGVAGGGEDRPILETRWSTEPARRIHELRLVRREGVTESQAPSRLELQWKDGSKHVLKTRREDGEELEAVLGALLRRFNTARLRIVKCLQQLWSMRTSPFNVSQHLPRLMAIASLLLHPATPLISAPSLSSSPTLSLSQSSLPVSEVTLLSAVTRHPSPPYPTALTSTLSAPPRPPCPPPPAVALSTTVLPSAPSADLWKTLGFVTDPSLELRSTGLLGLHCLEHAARCPITASTGMRLGCWATSSLTAAARLMGLLALRDNLIRSAPSDESWETPLFVFLCSCSSDAPFESVYLLLLQLFYQTHSTRAPGTPLGQSMEAALEALADALSRQPESIEQLRAWLL